VYQQSTVRVEGSGISCQWSSNSSSNGSNKKKIQLQQQFSIKVGSIPSFLPNFEEQNLVVHRAAHSAQTDDFEFRNTDDELLVCHLDLDIQADSFDLEETIVATTMDPASQSAVTTIATITPSTRLLYDSNPLLSCVSNTDSDNDIKNNKNALILDEFAFSCPTLDGVIQDVISTKESVFGIAKGTAFGACNIQIGTDHIRTTVRL
jgi:hypothetical protein